jgi:hypothetical protein
LEFGIAEEALRIDDADGRLLLDDVHKVKKVLLVLNFEGAHHLVNAAG